MSTLLFFSANETHCMHASWSVRNECRSFGNNFCCAVLCTSIRCNFSSFISHNRFPTLPAFVALCHASPFIHYDISQVEIGIWNFNCYIPSLRWRQHEQNKFSAFIVVSAPNEIVVKTLFFLASSRCDDSAVDMMNHTMANVNPPFKLNLRANISVWIIYEQKWKDVSFDSNRSSTPTFTSCHEMLGVSWIAAELWRKDKVFTQHKKGQTYGWKVEREAQQRAEEVKSWELKSNITLIGLIAQNYGWTTHPELESFCGLTLLGKGMGGKECA